MENKDLICPICGEPTSVYMGNARKDRLCRKHAAMLKNGEIVVDSKGTFADVKTKKILNADFYENKIRKETNENDDLPDWLKNDSTNSKIETKNNNIESIKIDQKIKCITCGYETEGKLFCKKCYAKYCNKEILIKIKNCKEVVPLDDFYEGYYECDDGHVVKSMAERDIDDFLFSQNIKHGYEIPIKIEDEKGKLITLHPDFCIFDEQSKPLYYIEYWGFADENRDYTKTKKFKMPLYNKAGITLININAQNDLRNLKINLQYKLNNFVYGKNNFIEE